MPTPQVFLIEEGGTVEESPWEVEIEYEQKAKDLKTHQKQFSNSTLRTSLLLKGWGGR